VRTRPPEAREGRDSDDDRKRIPEPRQDQRNREATR
jgi:hypothetical protein